MRAIGQEESERSSPIQPPSRPLKILFPLCELLAFRLVVIALDLLIRLKESTLKGFGGCEGGRGNWFYASGTSRGAMVRAVSGVNCEGHRNPQWEEVVLWLLCIDKINRSPG